MDFVLGWRKLFSFLPVLLAAVGVCGDTCKVTHQGKATTYNISNPKSNPTCDYSWADSNLLVLATDAEPEGKGIISSSHSSLTLLGCWKNVCVTIYCHLKHHTTCCYTNCPAAPEPPADFTAAPEPPADFTAAPEPPVGAFGDTCTVTHQGKATTYNISNPKSNPTVEYSWADSNLLVLATDAEPEGKGIISSSHSSLTLLGCWKNACVTIYCHLKPHTTCCYTNCTDAPEPQANFTAAPEPQADFTAAPEPPEHIDPMNCRDYWIVVRIPVVIVLLMVMVIAVVCCRKKENSWLERFNRACSSKEPQSGSGEDARPEVIPMLDV